MHLDFFRGPESYVALQTVDITYQEGVGAKDSSDASTKDHEDLSKKLARSSLDETAK